MPTQKNGIAVVKTNSGGMTLSNRLPRRQAATAPITVPRMNARMVRDAHQAEGPRQGCRDDLADGLALGVGEAEVSGGGMTKIGDVLRARCPDCC